MFFYLAYIYNEVHVADVLLSTCNGEAKWPLKTGHDIAQSTHLRLIDHDQQSNISFEVRTH